MDKELSAKVWAWVCVAISLGLIAAIICAVVYILFYHVWVFITFLLILYAIAVSMMIRAALIDPLLKFFYEKFR